MMNLKKFYNSNVKLNKSHTAHLQGDLGSVPNLALFPGMMVDNLCPEARTGQDEPGIYPQSGSNSYHL